MATAVTTYTITIDQSKIEAPDFPRPVDWWRHFLPIWFTHDNAQWWTKEYGTLVNSGVTVNEETGRVEIRTPDRKHALKVIGNLSRGVLRKFIEDTDVAICLERSTTTS